EEAKLRPHLDEMVARDQETRRLFDGWLHADSGPAKDRARAEYEAAGKRRDEFAKNSPAYARAFAVFDGQAADARVQVKGDPKKPGPEVPRHFLQILGG